MAFRKYTGFSQIKETDRKLKGSVIGEKSTINEVNIRLISIYFNSEIAILETSKNAQNSERFFAKYLTNFILLTHPLFEN